MNQERFDELTRELATNRLSRQQVLKGLAAGMVGALLGTVPLNMRARPALATGTSCAKQIYSTGSNFKGDAVTADVQFFDSLDAIDRCARSNNVFVNVTNSYREPGTIIEGPVRKQAQPGNHEAGHAIDMNVLYYDANGVLTNCGCRPRPEKSGCPPTTCLGGVLPPPVQGFIDCVKRAGLTWGGDYQKGPRDPVHIDDNLDKKDPALWRERITAMLESGPCPAGETCDTSGVCTNGQPGGCNVTCNPPKIPNPDKNCECECPGQSCAPPMAVNPDTCQCECPVSCNPPKAPNPQTCECECAVSCNPPQVPNPDTCQCEDPGSGGCPEGELPCGDGGACCPFGNCDALTLQCLSQPVSCNEGETACQAANGGVYCCEACRKCPNVPGAPGFCPAVECPPCQSCNPQTGTCEGGCGPCEVCQNGACQPKCSPCEICKDGDCVSNCGPCQVCDQGVCRGYIAEKCESCVNNVFQPGRPEAVCMLGGTYFAGCCPGGQTCITYGSASSGYYYYCCPNDQLCNGVVCCAPGAQCFPDGTCSSYP